MSNIQKLSAYLDKDRKIEEILGKNAPAFVSSVLTLVNNNRFLQKADIATVYTSALMAASLNLSIQPSLGHAYIIPYKDQAQFQLGYKGLIQLAQRTGQFVRINSFEVCENELIEYNPIEGNKYDFKMNDRGAVVGYGAYFELTNGYKHHNFMSVEEIKKHATRYSKSFGKQSGVWADNFKEMALKTVLKLLLVRYAPVSIEDQWHKATVADGCVIRDVETLDVDYIDNSSQDIETIQRNQERERIKKHIEESKDLADLEMVADFIAEYDLTEFYNERKAGF